MANTECCHFGDGAACVLLSSHEDDEGRKYLQRCIIFYDNIHMMGFKLTNSGLQMVLDIGPETIVSHFPILFIHFRKK
jgi:predicted naringenin-chalcone synthase